MQLTNTQTLAVHDAIGKLDGQTVTQVLDGKAVQVFKGIALDPNARWALALAKTRLATLVTAYHATHDALIIHHSNGTGQMQIGTEAFTQFRAEQEALNAQMVDVPIDPIDVGGLKLAENEAAGAGIPIAVLQALMPILK